MLTLEDVLIDPPPADGVIDWSAVFGNDRPVEVEIGCGKGGFLLRRARSRADVNFLGVEWAKKYCRYAADRMVRWGVPNVRLMRADAGVLVSRQLPAGSVAALHVYHPDPWPKRRHHKRRLFQPAFVDVAIRALAPGARWAIQTDHGEYFEVVRELLGGRAELEAIPFDDPEFGTVEARTETNFEVKYLGEGRAIYRLAYRR
jgi:tRNA (guanine-N7-)-methyltransferase